MLTVPRRAVLVASAAVLLALHALASSADTWDDTRPVAAEHLGCDRESFASIMPSEATLEKVAAVPEGGSYGEGAANIAYPIDPSNLPALCAVTVRVQSSPTSSYRFGLFLPDEWISRFLVVGNGGFAGGINWLDMAAGPRNGMASLSTDTGHNSTTTDSSWARGHAETKTDWGWRAIHGSTVLGKQLVRAYYTDTPLTYSYFSGCSTGGRQGLKELQTFPDSFDGALIGAPAWWTSHLNSYLIQAGTYNLPTGDPKRLSITDLALIAAEVTRQCDAADGVIDGIVSSHDLCKPNLTNLLCDPDSPPSSPSTCLTPAQLLTAHSVYNDWSLSDALIPRGNNPSSSSYSTLDETTLLHPGLTPTSEEQWSLLLNGTEPSPYGIGYARDFLFDDAAWDWRTSFNDSIVAHAETLNPGGATADDYAAMAAVRERGGKVVLYHGLADGLVPTKGTEVFYSRVGEALRGSVSARGEGEGDAAAAMEDFMRLFFVPGLQHCWGTVVDAPWHIGGAFQTGALGSDAHSVPGFENAKHDALMALVEWVEKGRAVERIVATTWEAHMNASSGVKRQRPLCAWPQRAVWDGEGDSDVASSWNCSG